MTREQAMQMNASACATFPWHAYNTSWRTSSGQPALFGLGADVEEALRRNMHAAALAMPMLASARRTAVPVWTPCTNLAFTLCAARGYLGNALTSRRSKVPKKHAPSMIYLTTRGSDIMAQCNSHMAEARVLRLFNATCPFGSLSCLRKYDAVWDECVITKHEYCVLTRTCTNGNEVWNATGSWECRRA